MAWCTRTFPHPVPTRSLARQALPGVPQAVCTNSCKLGMQAAASPPFYLQSPLLHHSLPVPGHHYLCLPYLQIEQVYMAVLGALPLPQDWFNRPHAVLADADLHPNKHLTWNPQKGPKAAVTHAT